MGISFCSAGIQTAAGFGGILIALTMGAHSFGVLELVDTFIPLGLLQGGYILFVDRKYVPWRRVLLQVLPIMGLGTLLGYLAQAQLSGERMKSLLGVVVVVLASRELYAWFRVSTDENRKPGHSMLIGAFLLCAGVMHGLMATGGPLLVYAMTLLRVDKRAFRAGLCAVFLMLNVVLIAMFIRVGRLDAADAPRIAALIPAMVFGIVAGQWVHLRIDARKFRLVIFALLLCAGVTLI